MRPPYSGIRRGGANPIACGRKFCASCGRWRLLVEFHRAYDGRDGGVHSYCETCYRRSQRKAYHARTEEQRELRREYDRFWTEAQRRKRGAPVRRFQTRSTVVDKVERILLDTGPLLREMECHILERQDQGEQFGWATLARQAGTSERALSRLRTGQSAHVRLELADRIAVAMGVPLALLYPRNETTNGARDGDDF